MMKDDIAVLDSTTHDGAEDKRSRKGRPQRSFFTKHQTTINFWLDTALLLNFLLLVFVAVVVQFLFPPAEAAAGYVLWGMGLSQWMDLQFGLLAVFFFGIIVHLMLHWSWVCGVISTKFFRRNDGQKRTMDDGQRTILGVGLMIVLLNIMGIAIAIAAVSIQSPL